MGHRPRSEQAGELAGHQQDHGQLHAELAQPMPPTGAGHPQGARLEPLPLVALYAGRHAARRLLPDERRHRGRRGRLYGGVAGARCLYLRLQRRLEHLRDPALERDPEPALAPQGEAALRPRESEARPPQEGCLQVLVACAEGHAPAPGRGRRRARGPRAAGLQLRLAAGRRQVELHPPGVGARHPMDVAGPIQHPLRGGACVGPRHPLRGLP
mmetsp:Transcript_40472/g.102917  ORF Transcript_40472/g.102917 Transcript_40472/m.102917 type:complete len:213 (+) Transcript_40472:198-836(+)